MCIRYRLKAHGNDARVIAEGHSLIPMMKLQMAEVPHLIDLQAIEGLNGISIAGGTVKIGAMITQHEIINLSRIHIYEPTRLPSTSYAVFGLKTYINESLD